MKVETDKEWVGQRSWGEGWGREPRNLNLAFTVGNGWAFSLLLPTAQNADFEQNFHLCGGSYLASVERWDLEPLEHSDPPKAFRSGKEPTCQYRRHKGSTPGGGHSNPLCILAWRIPRTEEPGGLQSVGLQRVGLSWSNWPCMQNSWRVIWGYNKEVSRRSGKIKAYRYC